jgi:hypothetical protein
MSAASAKKASNNNVNKNKNLNFSVGHWEQEDFPSGTWYISTPDMLEICHAKGIHFTNTAIEQWYGD